MSALHNLIQSHFGILGQEDASVLLRALLHALPLPPWMRSAVALAWYSGIPVAKPVGWGSAGRDRYGSPRFASCLGPRDLYLGPLGCLLWMG